ncbi:hypothetical protein [Fodinibius halophilus]|uniref:Uncharacterized protein n=1 Tax=Fodinibius halophilus TaxID=1736908 RepID=A0A6M1T752_9BACT|nr:hypothetical protein [Fodinibius halophilus]NGP87821.1 hypothetical protein [Fodinibius halophilus]
MNAGITTSFIVGGLLLLAMLQFSGKVFQNSAEITLDMNNKNQVVTIRHMLEHDFSRIGLGTNSSINSFSPPNRINFTADIAGNGPRTIVWNFQENAPVNSTSNPNDRKLIRTGPVDSTPGNANTQFAVVDFSITAFSDHIGKDTTTTTNDIKSILVEVVYESPEAIARDANEAHYSRSTWRKLFVPGNLNF